MKSESVLYHFGETTPIQIGLKKFDLLYKIVMFFDITSVEPRLSNDSHFEQILWVIEYILRTKYVPVSGQNLGQII